VTNLTAFGAFVDIGVHQDGLVHLSQIADRFVKDPGEVLKVRQTVEATVLAVDLERKRISLTLRKQPTAGDKPANPPEKKEIRENKPAGEGPRPKIVPGKPQTPGQRKPSQGKPRDEKVPFNNPFAAVFGKK
jgi:uncharacterized protein